MSMSDMFVLMVAALVFAVSVLFTYLVVSTMNNDSGFISVFTEAGITNPLGNSINALRTFDYGIATFIFVAGLVSIALAFMVKTHPIFFVVSLIVQIFIVMVSGILGNVFIDLTNDSMLNTITADFPITMLIFGTYFPTIILVMSALIAIVQFASPRTESGFSGF